MRFGVLGSVRAWRADGGEVPLGGPARRALLAALLLRPGRPVAAERLIDEVYGERPPKDAHHALQSQVSRLRRDGIAIERAGAGYLLRVDPDDVDVHRFLRLAAEGREALSRDDPVRAAELLREALGWWEAPAPAVHLEERHLAALEDLAEADLRRGAHDAALATLGELVERHPLRERPREQQMRALRAAGRPAEALLVYERTRRLLAEHLGADPSPELAALHQELLRGDHKVTRPPAHQPLTSFVGRDEDAARVAELVSRARLVTLVGPGGVGKTRLATEIAQRVVRKFPDMRLIELAHLRDGSDLPQTITSALGIRDGGLMGTTAHPGQPAARLVTALKGRDLLLVLDNCEQIIEAAAALSELLLRDCPGVRILATSREPLAITPEHLWPVRPLPLDQAVALFTDRAKAVRPGLATTPAIEAICANLDGLPLAIELAAARMRTHEPEELAARLESERFRLLSRGSRTAAERHRTLRAVVAWSWDLLTPDERTMAARLTVFAGGATAEAARRVCGLPDAESLLDSLADKSFADVADGRYRMLATIRDFCAEHLEDPGTVRLAHASHYLDVARTADPHLRTGDQLTWLNALAEEHADLRRALRWTVESGAHDLGVRLLGAQAQYLWMRGLRSAAAPEAGALLERAAEEGDDYVLCALIAGDPDRLRRAAPLVEKGHRHPLLAFLWPLMAANLLGPGSVLTLLARAESGADPWQRAMARLILAYPQMADARFGQAGQALTDALNDFRALGDRWGAALALDALGWLAATTGDRAAALAHTGEALTLAEHLGADEDHADLLCNRGDLQQLEDPAAARADYERALEVARRSGIPTYLAAAQRGLGDLARLAGHLPEARELYEKALAGTDAVWIKSAGNHARLLTGLGRLAEAEGDPASAASAYHRAITQAVVTGAVPECARAVEALADLAPPEEAARLLGAATALRGCAVPDRGERAVTAARLRAALGEESFTAAHAAGAGLTRAQALALVGVPEEVVSASPLLVSGR
ncbi:BTAD domain-containing putative transcriptional regulator [Nonomuraea typhae]|uniref:BTAD domain-containing putative transcriptional regulator n=1 Tax=Nonomuraea typhae TaxID=2603600 RepID=A0ABW7YWU3_9ACTN